MNLKKIAGRSIAIALIGVSVIVPVVNTSSAMEPTSKNMINFESNNDKKELEKQIALEGYKTIDMSEIPEGVTPVVVNSKEEFEKAKEAFQNEVSTMEQSVSIHSERKQPICLRSVRSSSVRYKNFQQGKWISMSKHNIFGTLKIQGNYIKSVHNLKQDWTGLAMGVNYQNHPTKRISYSLISNRQTAKIIAPWKANHYIFFEGIGHVSSRYGSTTFYVRK